MFLNLANRLKMSFGATVATHTCTFFITFPLPGGAVSLCFKLPWGHGVGLYLLLIVGTQQCLDSFDILKEQAQYVWACHLFEIPKQIECECMLWIHQKIR